MHRNILIAALAASVALEGCSSRPREFSPTLAPPQAGQATVDRAALDQAYATCRQLLVEGKLDQNGRLASAGAGAAASGAAMAVGTASAAAVAGYGGLAVLGATIVLLPFAVVGGAVGMAKLKRARKEKAIHTVMAGCLAERGYIVAGWQKVPRRPS